MTWFGGRDDAVVMVDSQPNTGRHSFSETTDLYAVIDHHDTPGDLEGVPFVDIRATLGATCTLVTKYLVEQNVPIPEKVATALLYGIETEVTGYPREAGTADDEALIYLYPLADKDLIAQIRNARLPQSHFECMLQALQSSFIYDRLIISWVDELPQPDHAAEVVDFMIRFEKVDWAVCGGVYQDKLILSVRAAIEDARAGELLRQVVGELGRAGGHDRRAGGCIRLASTAPAPSRKSSPNCAAGSSRRSRSRTSAVSDSSPCARCSRTFSPDFLARTAASPAAILRVPFIPLRHPDPRELTFPFRPPVHPHLQVSDQLSGTGLALTIGTWTLRMLTDEFACHDTGDS